MWELRHQGAHRVFTLGPFFYNHVPATARGCNEAGALDEDRWGLKVEARSGQVREGGEGGILVGGG